MLKACGLRSCHWLIVHVKSVQLQFAWCRHSDTYHCLSGPPALWLQHRSSQVQARSRQLCAVKSAWPWQYSQGRCMRRLCFKHIVADAVYLPHGMHEGKVVRPMQHNKTSRPLRIPDAAHSTAAIARLCVGYLRPMMSVSISLKTSLMHCSCLAGSVRMSTKGMLQLQCTTP